MFYRVDIIHSNPDANQGNSVATNYLPPFTVQIILRQLVTMSVFSLYIPVWPLREVLNFLSLQPTPVFQGPKHISLFRECFCSTL